MTDLHRDIGALEARADATDARLKRIEAKVDTLIDAVSQSKGGIRMLVTVGGAAFAIATALGALVAKLWPWGNG